MCSSGRVRAARGRAAEHGVRPPMTQTLCSVSRRLLLLVGVCGTAAMQAGCATSLVNAGREDAAHPIAELGEMKQPLQGVVLERTDLGGLQYLRVALPDARQSCQRTEALELLLPISNEASAAILRESTIGSEVAAISVPVYGTIGARPPGMPSTTSLPKDEAFRQWLARLDLGSNTISPIVIGYDQRMGIKALYRLGGMEPRITPIDVQSGWVCRSHIEHGFMVALYVPAVAFDVLTFPVQLVLFLLTTH